MGRCQVIINKIFLPGEHTWKLGEFSTLQACKKIIVSVIEFATNNKFLGKFIIII